MDTICTPMLLSLPLPPRGPCTACTVCRRARAVPRLCGQERGEEDEDEEDEEEEEDEGEGVVSGSCSRLLLPPSTRSYRDTSHLSSARNMKSSSSSRAKYRSTFGCASLCMSREVSLSASSCPVDKHTTHTSEYGGGSGKGRREGVRTYRVMCDV